MLIEQIIDFELREPEPSGRTCTPTTGYFHDKTKISRNIFQRITLLFTAKILHEAMYRAYPYLDQITNKFNTKCKFFNVFWT